MVSKARIDELIAYQEQWIRELQLSMADLAKYRDGTRPLVKAQIDNIANAQEQLTRAVHNMAHCIRDALN